MHKKEVHITDNSERSDCKLGGIIQSQKLFEKIWKSILLVSARIAKIRGSGSFQLQSQYFFHP